MTRWLILVCVAAGTALLAYLIRAASSTWTRRTPATSTDLAPVVTQMMTTLQQTVTAMTTSLDCSVQRLTTMAETLALGREQATTTTVTTTVETPSIADMWREIDDTPIPPGMEEVILREAQEDYLAHSLRERTALAAKLAQRRTQAEQLGVDVNGSDPTARGYSEDWLPEQ